MAQTGNSGRRLFWILGILAALGIGCVVIAVCAIFGVSLWNGRKITTVGPTARSVPPVSSTAPAFTPTLLSSLTPESGVDNPPEITDGHDAAMVLVPAGQFKMGSDRTDFPEETPAHTVYLDAFYIDKYEVTNAQYKACQDVGVCDPPASTLDGYKQEYYSDPSLADYPVVNVDWNMANAYCQWRGARLPTEAEWEKAARGTDGRTYPWGEDIACSNANYYDSNKKDNCVGGTTSVGTYPDGASPYGAQDMAGNVWEWVADHYSKTYYADAPLENPQGPDSGQFRVMRSGGWNFDEQHVRTSYRAGIKPVEYYFYLGFRCAGEPAALTSNPRPTQVSTPSVVSPTPQTEIPNATSAVQFNCTTGLEITVDGTAKGSILKICAHDEQYQLGPIAKGVYTVGPNGQFFVYCTDSGYVYAARAGDKKLTSIGDVKSFYILKQGDDPDLTLEIVGDQPYSVVVHENKGSQNETLPIPPYITAP